MSNVRSLTIHLDTDEPLNARRMSLYARGLACLFNTTVDMHPTHFVVKFDDEHGFSEVILKALEPEKDE